MPAKRISDLDPAAPLSGAETFVIVQGGMTKKAALSDQPFVVPATTLRVVAHGSVATTARPTGVGAVYWIGTVAPVNATTADLWVNA